MPNWVTCKIDINGSPKKINAIRKALLKKGDDAYSVRYKYCGVISKLRDGGDANEAVNEFYKISNEINYENVFDFNGVIKMPEHSDTFNANDNVGEDRMGGNNWYDWSVTHWGTKWNAQDAVLEEDDYNHLQYRLNTAWSAPIPVIEALSRKWKVDVTIQYFDEDLGENCGYVKFKNGSIDECNEYSGDEGLDFIEENFDGYVSGCGCFEKQANGHWKETE